jgi:WD40 repeat protein
MPWKLGSLWMFAASLTILEIGDLRAQERGGQSAQPIVPPRINAFGDPLPDGAAARLGALRFRVDGELSKILFTPDGRSIVGLVASNIVVWDAATGKELRRMPTKPPRMNRGMDISCDGRTLAIVEKEQDEGDDTWIGLWHLPSGAKVGNLSLPEGHGKDDHVSNLQFSADGQSLVVEKTHFGQAVVFDVASRKVRTVFGDRETESVSGLALSPDGKTAALSVYTPAIMLPKNRGRAVPFTIDVKLIDLATGRSIRPIYHPSPKTTAGISKRHFHPMASCWRSRSILGGSCCSMQSRARPGLRCRRSMA